MIGPAMQCWKTTVIFGLVSVLWVGPRSRVHGQVANDAPVSVADRQIASPVQPVELGRVAWMRDFEAAAVEADRTGSPLLILFQEVPGCATCRNFGKGPLSHPLVVDAAIVMRSDPNQFT